jgi:hypothetical protein
LLHCVLNRYGIETLPETLRIREGDHGLQVEFGVVPVGQDRNHNYRALVRRRSIIEVERASMIVACLPLPDSDNVQEDIREWREESGHNQNMFNMAVCNAMDQMLNHLVCERSITFGKYFKELCVSDVLIPSIAASINAGMEMLFKSQITNSGSCSQLMVEAILLSLGEGQVQELALEERPVIQEGVQILMQNWLQRSQRRQQRPHATLELS